MKEHMETKHLGIFFNCDLCQHRFASVLSMFFSICTICPRSSDPFNIVTYYIKRGHYFLDIQQDPDPTALLLQLSTAVRILFCEEELEKLGENKAGEGFFHMSSQSSQKKFRLKRFSSERGSVSFQQKYISLLLQVLTQVSSQAASHTEAQTGPG